VGRVPQSTDETLYELILIEKAPLARESSFDLLQKLMRGLSVGNGEAEYSAAPPFR